MMDGPCWGHLKDQEKYAVEKALVFREIVLARSLCCEIPIYVLLRKQNQLPAIARVLKQPFHNL